MQNGEEVPAATETPKKPEEVTKQSFRQKVWRHLETNGLAMFPRPVYNRIPNFKVDIYRQKVWRHLETNGLAMFPRPVYNRIPNFKGAPEAAAKLAELEVFKNANTVKVNPDKPQEPVRVICLEQHKTLYVPVPRLQTGFLNRLELPEGETGPAAIRKAVSRNGMETYGKPIDRVPEPSGAAGGGDRTGGDPQGRLRNGMETYGKPIGEHTTLVSYTGFLNRLELPEGETGPAAIRKAVSRNGMETYGKPIDRVPEPSGAAGGGDRTGGDPQGRLRNGMETYGKPIGEHTTLVSYTGFLNRLELPEGETGPAAIRKAVSATAWRRMASPLTGFLNRLELPEGETGPAAIRKAVSRNGMETYGKPIDRVPEPPGAAGGGDRTGGDPQGRLPQRHGDVWQAHCDYKRLQTGFLNRLELPEGETGPAAIRKAVSRNGMETYGKPIGEHPSSPSIPLTGFLNRLKLPEGETGPAAIRKAVSRNGMETYGKPIDRVPEPSGAAGGGDRTGGDPQGRLRNGMETYGKPIGEHTTLVSYTGFLNRLELPEGETGPAAIRKAVSRNGMETYGKPIGEHPALVNCFSA
ncbi:hypothetical protein NE865_08085 [Phthorimaea operculella]|nr:hypothetical protein NE865_08085 [Phthorimaea operculella]